MDICQSLLSVNFVYLAITYNSLQMATNKNALIRYQTLDKCLRNPGRRYFIDDLIEECNVALRALNPETSGIKKRQVFEDIKFMESAAGYDAEIVREKEGRKAYYRYADMNFSINSAPINEAEAAQLKEAILTLSRFKGMPQFEWIEELKTRLEDSFGFLKIEKKVIEFDQNPYLKGIEHLGVLYNAISYKKTLKICYQGFKQIEPMEIEFSPYYLKQYNNRWFLLAQTIGYDTLTNLALDRIISISEIERGYVDTDIDFEEYFEDVVGVTVPETPAEKILLRVSNTQIPYIRSKPIHGSQKIKETTDETTSFQIEVKINYELMSLLISQGIEVISPIALREDLKAKAEEILKINS